MNFVAKQIFHLPVNKIFYSLMKTHNFFREHEMPPQQRVEKAVGTFDENLCWLSSGQRSKKYEKMFINMSLSSLH